MATKPDKRIGNNGSQTPYWEPSPAEIAAECEKIRAEWSPAAWQRARRRYGASESPQGSYRLSLIEDG